MLLSTMLLKIVRVYPHTIKVPQRLLSGDALRGGYTILAYVVFFLTMYASDLSENPPYESLLETAEEVAVFKGGDKWFEPTILIDEDGKLHLPPNLSTVYAPIISKASQLYTQVCLPLTTMRV